MQSNLELSEKRQAAYRRRMHFFAEHPALTKLLHIVNRLLTVTVFLLYPLLLAWLFLNYKEYLLRALLVPFLSFVLVTVLRRAINRRRPYEAYGVPPAIPKATLGKSFPSRHVFSACVIAVTFLYFGPNPFIGAALLLAGIMLGLIRVLSGVHFASDVIVGAFLGILAGFIGYGLF